MQSFSMQILGGLLAASKAGVPAFMPASTVSAHSVARRVNPSYSGSLIRVRRGSDDAELDIGFDGSGNLDEAALLAFVGGGDGFIRTIYEQSGVASAVDFQQTELVRQPYIVQSGVVAKAKGRPTALQLGTGAEQRFVTFALWSTRPTDATVCFLASHESAGRAVTQVMVGSASNLIYSGAMRLSNTATSLASNAGTPSYYADGVFVAAQNGVDTRGDMALGFIDKGLQIQRHQEINFANAAWASLRTNQDAVGVDGPHEISEIFILSAPPAQDVSDLESNQAAYYGITLL